MKRLNVSFLWHMHQPSYIDAETGKPTLPWIRLHGTKAYYDMPLVIEKFPDVSVTLNLVPSLLEQIFRYTKNKSYDLFYDYTLKAAGDLTEEDKFFILRHFFMCNRETMIEPHREYHALLIKRGSSRNKGDIYRNIKRFSTQNFLDLQCWFNLAWFGFKAIERKPAIKELIQKGKNFTEEDKTIILKKQIEILTELPGIYKDLMEQKRIEVTLSPFYHPILPLLTDTNSAARAMPQAQLPSRTKSPEDAEEQIKQGIALYKETFGRSPVGMWPSEGSVSPEACEIIRKCGIDWIATDEEVLSESIGGLKNREDLFKPYTLNTPNGNLNVFFRDKNLSNLISFTYNRQDNQVAVSNFSGHLERILAKSNVSNPTLSIILDGENPWEYYKDKGKGFLESIYGLLNDDKRFKACSFKEALDSSKEKGKLKSIHSGSWINHNFDVWIGKQNTNKAWDLLKKTRDKFLLRISKGSIPEERVNQAWKELYTAEGSDWFWWFSDYFYTENADEFDRLFRSHLIKIYKLIDLAPPWELLIPICQIREDRRPTKPKGLLSPTIDGKVSNYYEWSNAGKLEITKLGSFMFEGKSYIDSIYYGFDLNNLYIRIDPLEDKQQNGNNGKTYNIDIIGSKYHRITFSTKKETKEFKLLESLDGLNFVPISEYNTLCVGNIIELSIPFELLEAEQKDKLRFSVSVKSADMELKRYPVSDYLNFEVPTEDFEEIMWMV